MMVYKIVNAFSGLGGNRLLWNKDELGIDVDIYYLENNEEIVKEYEKLFGDDVRIKEDVYEWLVGEGLEWMRDEEIDFLWLSPPCQSHSRAKFWGYYGKKVYYQDFRLYEIINLLKYQNIWSGKWVVENVIPFYKPLMKSSFEIDRHLFWSNFKVREMNDMNARTKSYDRMGILGLKRLYGIKSKNHQWLRNCTDPNVGKHILEYAIGSKVYVSKMKESF